MSLISPPAPTHPPLRSERAAHAAQRDMDVMLVLKGVSERSTEHLDVLARLVPKLHAEGLLTDF